MLMVTNRPGYAPFQLHVDRLAYYIRQGRIDPSLPITLRELYASGCTPAKKGGVRLYGTPSLSALDPTRTFPSLSIIVTKASPKAIRSVEAAGGTIVTRYHSPMAVRAITQPEAYEHQGKAVPRSSDPTSKRDLDYYASPENRGYIWLREANNVERSRARRSAKETATSSSTVTEGALPGQGGLENPPDRRAEEA